MTKPETTRNYLGIPVTGDISYAERRADQYTHEQVAELFSVVINDPTIKALGDHAQVTMTKEKITVETYEHD